MYLLRILIIYYTKYILNTRFLNILYYLIVKFKIIDYYLIYYKNNK